MATQAEVKLPKQVEEQAQMAEDFMAALRGEPADVDTDDETDGDDAGDSDAGEDGTADGNPVETADGDGNAAGESDEDGEEELSYRKRYETLQGKYNAEVPKLHDEVRKLKDSIIERLGGIGQQPVQVKPPEGDEDTVDPLDAKIAALREKFDDELVDFVEVLAERKARSLVNESITPVTEKIGSVESAQIESARSAFSADIDSKVKGDWQTLWKGEDPLFVAFLDTQEPNGLFTYRELAKHASDNWNADILAKVFNTYLEKYKPAKPTPPVVPEVPNKQQQSRVAPERKPVVAEPVANEAKIWTQADIRQFQDDDRKGKIPKEESEALWNDLLRAPAENRVVK